MGQEQNKFHIDNNGNIFKINEDGSFTHIGNASQVDSNSSTTKNTIIQKPSANLKSWLISNYNWLYLLSLTMLFVTGILCLYYNCYGDSAMLGMISMCTGVTAIVLPWIFKSMSKVWILLLFMLLIAALVTIITFSYEWLYTTQIALSFISLLTFGIALAKSSNHSNK